VARKGFPSWRRRWWHTAPEAFPEASAPEVGSFNGTLDRAAALNYASSYPCIYDVVGRIPAGRVLTYGEVATLAGLPGQARLVGYALHALPEHTTVPWHRVINAQGRISLGRAVAGAELAQRCRLEGEGVEFGAHGRVSLTQFRWKPS